MSSHEETLSEPPQLQGAGAAERHTVTHTQQIMSSGDKGPGIRGARATFPRAAAAPTRLIRGMAAEGSDVFPGTPFSPQPPYAPPGRAGSFK